MISTATLFLAGLVNGSIYSHVWGNSYIFDELEFLGAYFFDILVFCCLAFLLSLFIKKAGFVIVALFLYSIMFEPILSVILENAPYFKNGIWPELTPFFPIHALNDLIPLPFGKYFFQEITDNVPLKAIMISFVWMVIYIAGIYRILVFRDLK